MTKKSISVLLILCAAIFFCQFTVSAEDYGVTVRGVEITSGNVTDVLGDGTVYYDAATSTLTLDGADIEGGIICETKTVINLKGTNAITSNDNAVSSSASLTFTGDGSLVAAALKNGVFAAGLLEFNHTGTITSNGAEAGIHGDGAVIKVNSGNLNAYGADDGDSYGILCEHGSYEQVWGSVTASGGIAAVMVTSDTSGVILKVGDDVEIVSGGSVTSGVENGEYWSAFSSKQTGGKIIAGKDDASLKVITVKLYKITQQGENFFICDESQNALPEAVMGGTELKFIVFAASGYEAGKNYCVKVNGTELKADSGVYAITDIESDIVIEVDGMVVQTWDTGSSSGEGFFSKLNNTEVLIALFAICLAGLIAYVVVSNKKEEKSRAEKKRRKK